MVYNLGVEKLTSEFPNFSKAVKARDLAAAASHGSVAASEVRATTESRRSSKMRLLMRTRLSLLRSGPPELYTLGYLCLLSRNNKSVTRSSTSVGLRTTMRCTRRVSA